MSFPSASNPIRFRRIVAGDGSNSDWMLALFASLTANSTSMKMIETATAPSTPAATITGNSLLIASSAARRNAIVDVQAHNLKYRILFALQLVAFE